MRKETNLIKNILFFSIIIISIIFVVTGCNNENFNPNEQTEVYKLRKLNQKQINSTLDLQSFIDKISIKKTNKQTERLLQIDSLGFKLNTEIVSLIEGPNGYKSYSFFISRDSMVENKIENLVLIKEGYNEYKSYLVTYDFTLEEYLNLKGSSFENKDNIVKPLNFDISIFQDDELGKVVYAGRYIYIDCETEEWHWTGIRGEGYYVYTDCTIHHSGGGGGDDNSGTNDNYYIPDGYNEETNTYYNPRSGGENNGYNTGQSAYVFSPTVPTLEPWALVDFILGNSNNPNYTIEMRNWLENQRMASEEINTFLQNNNNSPEAQNFAIQAIEALMVNNLYNNYTQTDYPGKDLNFPFNWWNDSNFILNSGNFDLPSDNIDMSNEKPNATEVFLFGLFPSQAIQHIKNTFDSLGRAQELAPTFSDGINGLHNGKADAFRHSYWNALGTADFGKDIMKLFADAHELSSTNALETEMDLFNNNVGRNLAIQNDFGIFTSDILISNTIEQAIFSGNMKYINNNILVNTNN